MTQTKTLNISEIERFLKVRGWKRCTFFVSTDVFESPCGQWRVDIDRDPQYGMITVEKFTDADIQVQDVGSVATGRYETVGDECYSLEELEAELVSLGAMPWECPNCGEAGGLPQVIYSQEFQGDPAHGGLVHFEEHGCSRCIR